MSRKARIGRRPDAGSFSPEIDLLELATKIVEEEREKNERTKLLQKFSGK